MIVRERLTGRPPPVSSRKVVELWRDWIEERAGDNFDKLGQSVEDQGRFALAVRDLIASLDMADELGGEKGDDNEDDGEAGEPEENDGAADASDAAEASSPEDVEAAAEDAEAGEGESSEAEAEDMIEDSELSDAREAGEVAPLGSAVLEPAADLRLSRLHHALRRDRSRRRTSATPRNSTACAPISTSSSPISRARSAASPTGCSGG